MLLFATDIWSFVLYMSYMCLYTFICVFLPYTHCFNTWTPVKTTLMLKAAVIKRTGWKRKSALLLSSFLQVGTRSPGPWTWSWRTWSCCVQMEPRLVWTSTSGATWQPSLPKLWWCAWRTSAASGSSWNVYRWVDRADCIYMCVCLDMCVSYLEAFLFHHISEHSCRPSLLFVWVCVCVLEMPGWLTHPVMIPWLQHTHIHKAANTHPCAPLCIKPHLTFSLYHQNAFGNATEGFSLFGSAGYGASDLLFSDATHHLQRVLGSYTSWLGPTYTTVLQAFECEGVCVCVCEFGCLNK